jgi:translocation protein SEC62
MTKEEDAIARFVRFNCPTKQTMFEGNEVHYFVGSKAVDTLVESKKFGANSKKAKFTTRASATTFLQNLLDRGLFFRAKKLVLKKKEKEDKKPKDTKEDKDKKKPKEKDTKEEDNADMDSGTDSKKVAKSKEQDEDKKKKKKVKLNAHDTQIFLDSTDVYVWIFDPTPLFKKIIGLMIVFGTIAGCLFPLWPDWLRLGVYYLSVTGIAAFGLLFAVALARTLLFATIWLATMGRHKLWVLPNLLEDCGVFESFQPYYTYEYCPPKDKSAEEKKKSKKKDEKATCEEKEELQKDKEKMSTDKNSESEKSDAEEDENSESTEKEKNSDDDSEVSDEGEQEEPSEISSPSESASPEKPRRRRPRARRDDDDFVLVNDS